MSDQGVIGSRPLPADPVLGMPSADRLSAASGPCSPRENKFGVRAHLRASPSSDRTIWCPWDHNSKGWAGAKATGLPNMVKQGRFRPQGGNPHLPAGRRIESPARFVLPGRTTARLVLPAGTTARRRARESAAFPAYLASRTPEPRRRITQGNVVSPATAQRGPSSIRQVAPTWRFHVPAGPSPSRIGSLITLSTKSVLPGRTPGGARPVEPARSARAALRPRLRAGIRSSLMGPSDG